MGVDIVKNGHGQSSHRTLKLTVSRGLIDWMNWYFPYWYKFRKAKSYFNDFWVGIVRNGHGYLIHETLKSAVYREWVYEFSLFFACWLWGSHLWSDKHHTLCLWLVGRLAVAESVRNRVCPSFYPAVCWVVFLELDH